MLAGQEPEIGQHALDLLPLIPPDPSGGGALPVSGLAVWSLACRGQQREGLGHTWPAAVAALGVSLPVLHQWSQERKAVALRVLAGGV